MLHLSLFANVKGTNECAVKCTNSSNFIVETLGGLTGMGGGALMTPALIFLGVEPVIAVGADLLYATITRGLVFSFITRIMD